MGGRYGGYATLVGLTRNPETYACGIDIVGPSNLETLIRTIPPYWEAIRSQILKAIGDPDTEEGLSLLRERSPLFQAGRIAKPLLIAQGANDPRVKQAEADQMVEALKEKGIPVTYLLFPDEGHGFARPENNVAFRAVAENFLARHLGRLAEPIHPEELTESTIDRLPNSVFKPYASIGTNLLFFEKGEPTNWAPGARRPESLLDDEADPLRAFEGLHRLVGWRETQGPQKDVASLEGVGRRRHAAIISTSKTRTRLLMSMP